MKLDKADRRDTKRNKARRAMRVNSRVIMPLQSEAAAKAALAFAKVAR